MKLSIGPGLRQLWRRISSLPGGRWLFSRALGWYVPYTNSRVRSGTTQAIRSRL